MNKKQEYLKQLEQLDEVVLERLAELSKDKKALSYFNNSVKFALVKGFLKK